MYGLEYIDIIKQRNNGKVPIDQLWNIHDNGFFGWYDIYGFNGYQISFEQNSKNHFIRSYKFKNQYPFGILILPKNKDTIINHNPKMVIYQLSDNDNMRIEISLDDILKIVNKNHNAYPYSTAYIPHQFQSSRNKRMCIDQDPEKTANKKGLVRKSAPLNHQENTKMVTFTVSNNPKPLAPDLED